MLNFHVIVSACGIFVLYIFRMWNFRVIFSACGIFVLYFLRVEFLCCIFCVVFFQRREISWSLRKGKFKNNVNQHKKN